MKRREASIEERQSWLAERVHMFANISTYIAQYVYLPPIIITIMAMIWLLPAGSNDIYWISMFKIPLVALNPLITVFYSHSVIATAIQLRSHVRAEQNIISDVWSARAFVKTIFFIELIAFFAEVAELIWRAVRFGTGGFPDSDQGYSLSLTFIVITAYALAGLTVDIFLNGFSFIVYLKEIGEYLELVPEMTPTTKSVEENSALLKQPVAPATSAPPAPIVASSTSRSHYSSSYDEEDYPLPPRQRKTTRTQVSHDPVSLGLGGRIWDDD